jgi:hypothetical protein
MNDHNWHGDEPNICKLGEKWFKNFLKRYKHMVRPQKPCTYDMHKKNYTTFVNFNQMYLNCEEAMISSGVAARRDVPILSIVLHLMKQVTTPPWKKMATLGTRK